MSARASRQVASDAVGWLPVCVRRIARGLLFVGVVAMLLAACGQPEDPTPPPTATPRLSATSTATTPADVATVEPTATQTANTDADAASTRDAERRATAMWAAITPSVDVSQTPTTPAAATAPPADSAGGTAVVGVGPGPGTGGVEGTAVAPGADGTPSAGDVAAATATLAAEPTATPEPPPPTPTPEPCPGAIPWEQAAAFAGQQVTVIGPVASATWASGSRGQPTFLNVGLPYPDPGRFTVLIWIDARWNFPDAPEVLYANRTICVSGTVEMYEGSPEMEVFGPEQIVVVE